MAKYTVQDVLKATERQGIDRSVLLAYQVGVMAAWLARIANDDTRVARELRARYQLNTPNKGQ